jgi:hypothetical protein
MENAANPITKAEVVINLLNDLLKFRLDIENALAYSNNSHTFDNIVDMVVTGTAHFYPLENAFMLMEVQTFPQHKVYNVFLAGGDLQEILATQKWVNDNAYALGCKYATMSGRNGWSKVLKDEGWDFKFVVMYKTVEEP